MDVACLIVPNFLVALARREHPELAKRPVVVGGAPEEHAAVTACSPEAAAAGVTVGTTLRRALAHCKRHLTAYKIPRVVEFRSEPLPKSNIGKILRRELRDDKVASPAAPAVTA